MGVLERSRSWSGGRRRGPCIQGGVGILTTLVEGIGGIGFRVFGWEWEEEEEEEVQEMERMMSGRLDWGGVGLGSECGPLDGGRVGGMKRAGSI